MAPASPDAVGATALLSSATDAVDGYRLLVLDGGSNVHILDDHPADQRERDLKPVEFITVGGQNKLPVDGGRTCLLRFAPEPGSTRSIEVQVTFALCPGFGVDIISEGELWRQHRLRVRKEDISKLTLGRITSPIIHGKEGLPRARVTFLPPVPPCPSPTALAADTDARAPTEAQRRLYRLWHCRLGHPSVQSMAEIAAATTGHDIPPNLRAI